MKRIIFILIILIISFVILIFYFGLEREKIYDTKDLIGKSIVKIDLNLLNENKI